MHRPDAGTMNSLEHRANESCMGTIGTVEGYRQVEGHLTEMMSKSASAAEIRNYLISEGFKDSQLQFSDSVFLEPRGLGYYDEHPVLESARLIRGGDCESFSTAQRNDAVSDSWLRAALLTLLGLGLLWVALLGGRATMRWILRGT